MFDVLTRCAVPSFILGCMRRLLWLALGSWLPSEATVAIDLAAEAYFENTNGECVIAIPMLVGIGKLATATAQGEILKKIQAPKQQAATMCIYPVDHVAKPIDTQFKQSIRQAVLSKSVKPGMLMLDCLGPGDKIMVTYFWKSQFTGSMVSGIPALPIYEPGSFIVKGSLLDKLRKKLTWNNQPKGPTIPLINAYKDDSNPPKESVEAYAYCRELFEIRQSLVSYIKRMPFPSANDAQEID